MGKFKFLASAVALALTSTLAGAPGLSQPAIAQTTVDADPALWVVKDADTTVYLFGTVHVLKPGLSWFDEGVKAAYDKSGEVVLELIQPDAATMQAAVMAKAVDADGPPLTQKLSPDAAAAYGEALGSLGMPPAALDKFEPWFAAMTLAVLPLQKFGYDPNSGVEKTLAATVKADGKTLGALETLDQQLGFFDSLPEPLQIEFLESTVEGMPQFEKMMGDMVSLWAKGDAEGLAVLMNDAMRETPELAKLLLADRNARWAEWVDARMDKPGTVFVAVGAGHLAGPDSVQAMLRKRGIKTERVKY